MILALDIGGTKLATAAFHRDGTVDGLQVEPTRRSEGPAAIIPRLFAMGHRSLALAGIAAGQLDVVGISCGGPLDAAGGILLSPPHLPGWDHVELGPMVSAEFGVPFALENDATAAALGQWRFGAGRGSVTMLYLTLSTGVGGGAVIGGCLHRGAAGNGGELGHIMVRPGGRACVSCGRRGCLEAYCSGTNIGLRAAEVVATGEASSLAGLATITGADVSRAAAAGDPVARRVWEETTALLGQGLTDLTNVFEPELIVLGGGATNAGPALLEPVRRIVREQAMGPAAEACTIVLADRPDLAGVIGAGAIGLQRAEASTRTAPVTAPAPAPEPRSLKPMLPDDPAPAWLEAIVDDHLATAEALRPLLPRVLAVADLLTATFEAGGCVYTFGNGGSAADAQHLSGELIGHYRRDRRALPCLTLSTDPSVLTCTANDFSYEEVFARQVEALARPGAMFIAFTTSGRSPNIVQALRRAREAGAMTVLFGGAGGGPALQFADHALVAPSDKTARIQEMHTTMLHMLSEHVDAWAAGEEPQA